MGTITAIKTVYDTKNRNSTMKHRGLTGFNYLTW